MAEVKIKCPSCGEILSADDKYLRYTVECGVCHNTFIFNSICIEGNQGTIPVFPSIKNLLEEKAESSEKIELPYESLKDIKVGKIARAVFFYALRNNLCSDDELIELMSEEKSRKLFHFGYPLLVSTPKSDLDKSILIIKGRHRYYCDPVYVGEKAFFVCSQWFDYNRSAMLAWAARHNISSKIIESIINSDMSEQDYLSFPEIIHTSNDEKDCQIKEAACYNPDTNEQDYLSFPEIIQATSKDKNNQTKETFSYNPDADKQNNLV